MPPTAPNYARPRVAHRLPRPLPRPLPRVDTLCLAGISPSLESDSESAERSPSDKANLTTVGLPGLLETRRDGGVSSCSDADDTDGEPSAAGGSKSSSMSSARPCLGVALGSSAFVIFVGGSSLCAVIVGVGIVFPEAPVSRVRPRCPMRIFFPLSAIRSCMDMDRKSLVGSGTF